jgi:hypothetical protein
MNDTEYSLKGTKKPIQFNIDGETEITLEPFGCWKEENETQIINGKNPDGEYHFYPEWTCWYSLWSRNSHITVHFFSDKNARNKPCRIFINPDINHPSIKWFKDHILEIVVTFSLIIVFLICCKKLGTIYIIISGLVSLYIILYIWQVNIENMINFLEDFVKFFEKFTKLIYKLILFVSLNY